MADNAISYYVEQAQRKIDAARKDGEKFMKGNKAAGVRFRKAMLDIKRLAHDARGKVTEIRNHVEG